MNCPSCGLDNPDSATYCDDCGALLASSIVLPDQPLRRELLAIGTVVSDRYVVNSAEPRGIFNLYEAARLDNGERCRILEDAERLDAEGVLCGPDPAPSPASSPEQEPPAAALPPAGADPVAGGDAHAVQVPASSRAGMIWKALQGASSPHLWEVRDFVAWEGRTMVVGPMLPDWTLKSYLETVAGPLEADEVRALGLSLLEAVEILHGRGFLHLGIHPENVYLDEEGRAILDGFERLVLQDGLPAACSVLEGYSAPEAYGVGGSLCPASDVFGVGATLYYSIARQVPTQANREHFFTFTPLSRVVPTVAPGLATVVMQAVRKDLASRYLSAASMREDLDGCSLEPGPAPAEETLVAEPDAHAAVTAPLPPPPPPPLPLPATAASTAPTGAPTGPLSPSPAQVPATAPTPRPTGFLPYRVGMKSHVGCIREVNQDSMLVMAFSACERSVSTPATLLIVADGMGGEAEGDKASSLAIRGMATHIMHHQLPIVISPETTPAPLPVEPVARLEKLLRESMTRANEIIFQYSQMDPSRRGMGSTLTSVMLEWPHAVFGHAGDTRAYLIRGGLDQVTEDHSLVGKLVRMGQLTREEARNSPQRSYLYRAMGTAADLEMDVYQRSLEPGDRMLICSDGVWEYFTDEEIMELMSRGDDPQATCEALVAEVLKRGADDNCTAIVLHVPQGSLPGVAATP